MLIPDEIALGDDQRLNETLLLSWRLFKGHFFQGRHPIEKEAAFQHHFATIISNLGHLYCLGRHDTFMVDLETTYHLPAGAGELDISCQFNDAKAAIELKFPKQQNAGYTDWLPKIYSDIQTLERLCNAGYSVGQFYMMTQADYYLTVAHTGARAMLPTYNGYVIQPHHDYNYGGQVFNFAHPYEFVWEEINGWHLLVLVVK